MIHWLLYTSGASASIAITKMIFSRFFGKPDLSKLKPDLNRDELIQRCRILVIDDQRPKLIDDLTKSGFAVEYDAKGDDLKNVEKGLYDLILLDFGGVGEVYGKDQGLSLLRHIKRVNPVQFILAYTSKNLTPEQSEFYRLTDGTLFKDAGIQESFAKIEDSLRDSLDVERLWKATLALTPVELRSTLEKALMKSIDKKSRDPMKQALSAIGSKFKDKIADKSIEKVLDLALEAVSS